MKNISYILLFLAVATTLAAQNAVCIFPSTSASRTWTSAIVDERNHLHLHWPEDDRSEVVPITEKQRAETLKIIIGLIRAMSSEADVDNLDAFISKKATFDLSVSSGDFHFSARTYKGSAHEKQLNDHFLTLIDRQKQNDPTSRL